MGDDVEARTFTRADRTRYRQKVRHSLDVFARMLRESRFDAERQTIGCEIELNLVDEHGDPAMRNEEVLKAIAHPDFQTELGQFNVEINVPPRPLSGASLSGFEDQVRAVLNSADQAARGEEREPPAVQPVADLAELGRLEAALGDSDGRHGITATCRLAASRSSAVACDHCRNRCSPAPITAGMPSSIARIAMCELTPPNAVTSPAIPLAKSQS